MHINDDDEIRKGDIVHTLVYANVKTKQNKIGNIYKTGLGKKHKGS